ncbi:MAG TPA: OmpA family protein [Stellaceae bacterium]|nr:OmpA family protein [Stellaceae bacterium]
MRFTIGGAAAALLLASVAPAGAQAPPPMMFGGGTWGGFYLGLNVGGAQSSGKDAVPPTGLSSQVFDFGGPLGGGTAGFNWQVNPNWVLGFEGDMDAAGMSGSTSCPVGLHTYVCNVANRWLGTARGRIGYAPTGTNMLVFATGGAAFGDVDHTVTGPVHVAEVDSTQVGWTVGGGIEDMFAPAWSAKVEYRYVQLTSNATMNMGLLGVNYHFGHVAPPPPAPVAAPAPPPAPPKVFIVFFDWDKDTITPEGHAIIQQAADAYKAGAPVQLQVTGYTDRSGSPGYNQRLSERRANNVARAMAALGVPKEQMIVSGRGENDNRVPTADGVREPQNRRVEIVAP